MSLEGVLMRSGKGCRFGDPRDLGDLDAIRGRQSDRRCIGLAVAAEAIATRANASAARRASDGATLTKRYTPGGSRPGN